MFDIKQVKSMLLNGGLALNDSLEKRILNDQMTDQDHAFLSKTFGFMRENGLKLAKSEVKRNEQHGQE